MTTSTPLDDVLFPTVRAAALTAASDLGLFRALDVAPQDCDAIAERLEVPPRGLRSLLEVLSHTDYVERLQGGFALGPMASSWLTQDSPVDFHPLFAWSAEVWRILGESGESIRRGGPPRPLWNRLAERPELGPAFSEFMKTKSLLTLNNVVDAIDLSDAISVLDIGGAHGLHSVSFCERYPRLKSTIMDFPASLTKTSAAIERAGLSDRIALRPGDYMQDSMGEGYDALFCFEVLHNHTPEECERLVRRIGGALKPGGQVAVLEPLRGDAPAPDNAALSHLIFLYTGTQTYGYADIAGWLEQAGFQSVSRIDVAPGEALSLVTARRPGDAPHAE